MSDFSERLRKALYERGVKQVHLARKVGVSRNQVYKWLTGRDMPSYANLFSISSVLGVEPYTFLTGHVPATPELKQLAEDMKDSEGQERLERWRQARLLPEPTFEVLARNDPYRTLLRLVLLLDYGAAEKLLAFIFPDNHEKQVELQNALPKLDAFFAKLEPKKPRRKLRQ